jgi:hypothetical protein
MNQEPHVRRLNLSCTITLFTINTLPRVEAPRTTAPGGVLLMHYLTYDYA